LSKTIISDKEGLLEKSIGKFYLKIANLIIPPPAEPGVHLAIKGNVAKYLNGS
jgi:hypothetical protein